MDENKLMGESSAFCHLFIVIEHPINAQSLFTKIFYFTKVPLAFTIIIMNLSKYRLPNI